MINEKSNKMIKNTITLPEIVWLFFGIVEMSVNGVHSNKNTSEAFFFKNMYVSIQ